MTCNLGALADDVTARLTITVRVLNSASESLTNSVAVAASESDPNPTNNDHLALTTVVAGNPPAFDVPATPPSGATFTMIAGESLQFNVQVSDFDIQADVTQITAGTDHTCALLDTGVVRCWGWGGLGQLGYGNISSIGDNETPADAGDVDVGGAVVQIDAGHAHTCAVLDTGAVRCWGSGGFSNLGYGNTSNIGDNETPATAGDVDVGGTVAQIASGTFHTCALLDTGAVRCWGAGGAGRLGYNNAITIGDNETPATAYASLPNGGDVGVGGTVAQIAVSKHHTCALLDTGAVRCWGLGTNGRLGYATTTNIGDDETPADAGDVDVGGTVAQIVAGEEHTCALLDTGAVRCWGVGGSGRLGYGNDNNIGDDETPASAGDVAVGGTVVQIDAGGFHTCALLDTGTVRCWGAGGAGRLGYGNTLNIGGNATPASAYASMPNGGNVDIGGIAVQIATGSHTCPLLDTGAVRCWGSSGSGKLGYSNSHSIGDNETPASAGDVDIADPGDVVTLGVVGLPAGAVFAPGTPANPVSATFTWVPTGADVGSHAVTFTAQDNTTLIATPHVVNIEVQPGLVTERLSGIRAENERHRPAALVPEPHARAVAIQYSEIEVRRLHPHVRRVGPLPNICDMPHHRLPRPLVHGLQSLATPGHHPLSLLWRHRHQSLAHLRRQVLQEILHHRGPFTRRYSSEFPIVLRSPSPPHPASVGANLRVRPRPVPATVLQECGYFQMVVNIE